MAAFSALFPVSPTLSCPRLTLAIISKGLLGPSVGQIEKCILSGSSEEVGVLLAGAELERCMEVMAAQGSGTTTKLGMEALGERPEWDHLVLGFPRVPLMLPAWNSGSSGRDGLVGDVLSNEKSVGDVPQWLYRGLGTGSVVGVARIDCQAGWGWGLVGPLFLTGLRRGPHASRPPLPFSEGPQAFCSSILAEEAGLGFLLALCR